MRIQRARLITLTCGAWLLGAFVTLPAQAQQRDTRPQRPPRQPTAPARPLIGPFGLALGAGGATPHDLKTFEGVGLSILLRLSVPVMISRAIAIEPMLGLEITTYERSLGPSDQGGVLVERTEVGVPHLGLGVYRANRIDADHFAYAGARAAFGMGSWEFDIIEKRARSEIDEEGEATVVQDTFPVSELGGADSLEMIVSPLVLGYVGTFSSWLSLIGCGDLFRQKKGGLSLGVELSAGFGLHGPVFADSDLDPAREQWLRGLVWSPQAGLTLSLRYMPSR